MRLIENYDGVCDIKGGVLALGTFDGVHLGHRHVIQFTLEQAKNIYKTHAIVLTFSNHPQIVLQQNGVIKLLSTLDEKLSHFEQLGVDVVLLISFTETFSKLNPEVFFDRFIGSLHPDAIVIGREFYFGHRKSGNATTLSQLCKKNHIEFYQLPAFTLDGQDVSSSVIRQALLNGQIAEANRMLGYHYTLKGTVVEGFRIGRKIGYPTANIKIEPFKLIPRPGVYSVRTNIDGKELYGMLYIGYRPTFDMHDLSIELHLFQFHENIYGRQLKIECLHFIREDRKFMDVECLRRQIEKDEKIIKNLIGL